MTLNGFPVVSWGTTIFRNRLFVCFSYGAVKENDLPKWKCLKRSGASACKPRKPQPASPARLTLQTLQASACKPRQPRLASPANLGLQTLQASACKPRKPQLASPAPQTPGLAQAAHPMGVTVRVATMGMARQHVLPASQASTCSHRTFRALENAASLLWRLKCFRAPSRMDRAN